MRFKMRVDECYGDTASVCRYALTTLRLLEKECPTSAGTPGVGHAVAWIQQGLAILSLLIGCCLQGDQGQLLFLRGEFFLDATFENLLSGLRARRPELRQHQSDQTEPANAYLAPGLRTFRDLSPSDMYFCAYNKNSELRVECGQGQRESAETRHRFRRCSHRSRRRIRAHHGGCLLRGRGTLDHFGNGRAGPVAGRGLHVARRPDPAELSTSGHPARMAPVRGKTMKKEYDFSDRKSELQSPCNLVCRLLLEKK